MAIDNDFTQRILSWYEVHQRQLPWRNISDPYRIWVSEIILQQTRITQGYEYYLRFIKAFPTVANLAHADEDEVLKLWQGLGYYSRACNMRTAAQTILDEYKGQFPTTYKEVLSLKGIGAYTAAAICSFAYNLPYAVVDGNVYRVLSRYYGIDLPIDSTQGKKHFAQLAQELLPTHKGADYNQGLMDFGALQCTPQSPACETCPLSYSCYAYSKGQVELFPYKSKKVKTIERHFVYVDIITPNGHWLRRRGKNDIWQGLYEFPLLEFDHQPSFEEVVAHPFIENIQAKGCWREMKVNVKHVLTHQIIFADYYQLSFNEVQPLPEGFKSVAEGELSKYAMPQLLLKLTESS